MAGQQWSVSADGGFMANPPLSKKLRTVAQPLMKFRTFTRPVDAFGKNKGDSVDFEKVSNIQTQGGKIPESSKMPETKFQIVKDTLTIDEYGNSIPYTGKLENLSEFNIANPVQKALRDDMAKVMDIQISTEMKKTKTKYAPLAGGTGTFDNDGTMSTTATSNLEIGHLKQLHDALRTGIFGADTFLPVPAFTGPDGDYILICSVKAARGLKDDPEWEEWLKYTKPDALINGELGRIQRFRVVEQTHAAALSESLAGGILGEAIVFGDDPIVEGVAVPEELRAKIPGDYGRDKGVAWYFLGGWKIVWSHLATDTVNESHIIHITSA